MFKVPNDSETYVNQIVDRSNELIYHKIWSGFERVDLKIWLNNFKTPEEKYFAACILDSLIVRSESQTVSLAMELFTRKIPQLLSSKGFNFNHSNELLEILSKPNFKIRLVKVESAADRLGKSYDFIFRLYRREFGLTPECFISPDEIDSEIKGGIDTFIFIDDILCTGTQFSTMYRNRGLGLKLKNKNIIYAPLVAHQEGITRLNELDSSISVVYTEYLEKDSSVFDFDDEVNDSQIAKEFYLKLLDKYKFSIPNEKNKFGYGNLALTYCFAHGISDNCLNILWDKTDEWNPLIKR